MISTQQEFKLIITGLLCPYCKSETEHVTDTEVYSGNGYGGMIYLCRPCGAYVGCHTNNPNLAKGRLANKGLRDAKIEAHHYFDNLWKRKKGHANKNRIAAYKWLAGEMKVIPEHCHIGMFDIDECNRVVEICKPYYQSAR